MKQHLRRLGAARGIKTMHLRLQIRKYALTILLIGILAGQLPGCATEKIVGGPITEGSLKDGVYEGSASVGPVKVVAEVTIDEHRIARVELLEHRTWKGGAAEGVIPGRIIEAQSTQVDAVSGATMSSRAIMNAVEVAIRKAE